MQGDSGTVLKGNESPVTGNGNVPDVWDVLNQGRMRSFEVEGNTERVKDYDEGPGRKLRR